MAEAAVTFMLETLKERVTSEMSMISGAKVELQRLENDLRLLKGFLCDAARNPTERSRELDLERQIKEVVYDIEDTLEPWLIQTRMANNKIFGRFRNPKHIHALARDLKSIRDGRVVPLYRRIEAYGDLQLQTKHSAKVNHVPSVHLNKEVPQIQQNNTVGFKDEAETLISCLMKETDELDIISITGMPGVGKTTLARAIYQSQSIQTRFPTRIWVDIPLDFCNKDLHVIILTEFIRQGMIGYPELVLWLDMPEESCSEDSFLDIFNEYTESGRINDRQLIHAVRHCLEKSRFLLVMDGVWTADTLHNVRCFFPNWCKVLITSRNNHVTPKPHVLRFLDEEESWELLQLEVFGELNACPETLTSMGKSIAKSCDGSPLAISVVASRLVVQSSAEVAKDLTKQWWNKVSVDVAMCVTEYGAQQNVFGRVELSYNKMPQCLQNCFLYLAVFPQGQEIPVWTLTCLWIAEGLIQDSWGLCLEETAEQNLHELINKNMVIVGKIYPNGQIKTCRLHTLMYGFCKYKAAEQDFYHEIRMSRGGALDCPMPLTPNYRRLCIQSSLSEFLSSGPKGPCVRSILCFDKEDKILHPKHSSNIHKSFKLLKVLECKSKKFTKFPTKLSILMNLRYISLCCDELDVIPENISSLRYLETLVVDTRSPSLKLKANIWRMLRLQHLVTKAAIVLAIQGKGEAGKSLQTLTRLAPQCCTEDVLARVPNLKRLGIRGQLAALSISAESLIKLECLERLKLINEPSAAPDTQLHRLFVHLNCFPPNIKRLTLSATHLEWKSMSVLGKIDSLEILKLKNNAFTGGSWNATDADGFRRLGFLFIGTTDLVSWEASSADFFPSLKCLVLKNCGKLEKIPLALGRSLHTLDVQNLSESAVESAREIEREQKGRLHEFKLCIRLVSDRQLIKYSSNQVIK